MFSFMSLGEVTDEEGDEGKAEDEQDDVYPGFLVLLNYHIEDSPPKAVEDDES